MKAPRTTDQRADWGIDPGKDGGIVELVNGQVNRVWLTPTVGREYDTVAMLEVLQAAKDDGAFVTIEACQAFPKIGAGTNFKVGHGYGLWLGLLAALGIPHMIVHPRHWHKRLCHGVPGATPKARALVVAARLWPGVSFTPGKRTKPHDGLVDAALIAEYGRRERGGA